MWLTGQHGKLLDLRGKELTIRGNRVLLLSPAQIIRLDNAHVEGRRAQIRMNARQMARYISYSLFSSTYYLDRIYNWSTLVSLAKGLLVAVLLEVDSFYINMVNAIEYRNIKVIVCI